MPSSITAVIIALHGPDDLDNREVGALAECQVRAGELVEAVTSKDGGRALEVHVRDGDVVEEDIPCRRLEDRGASRSVSA